MPSVARNGVSLAYRLDGPPDGKPVVLLHALGLSGALWDALLPHLPADWRILRPDHRGHGASDVPASPYAMGALVGDAEAIMDAEGMRGALVVGISMGGLIAQGLAVKRPDLVRALVLSNTAARIGTPQIWAARAEAARAGGMCSQVAPTLERWFARKFRDSEAAQAMGAAVAGTALEGYLGCVAAIAGSDFYTPLSGLRIPVLGIAGDHDGSTPPDLVRESVDLVPGSRFVLMHGSGHLPCVDAPVAYAQLLREFATECQM